MFFSRFSRLLTFSCLFPLVVFFFSHTNNTVRARLSARAIILLPKALVLVCVCLLFLCTCVLCVCARVCACTHVPRCVQVCHLPLTPTTAKFTIPSFPALLPPPLADEVCRLLAGHVTERSLRRVRPHTHHAHTTPHTYMRTHKQTDTHTQLCRGHAFMKRRQHHPSLPPQK